MRLQLTRRLHTSSSPPLIIHLLRSTNLIVIFVYHLHRNPDTNIAPSALLPLLTNLDMPHMGPHPRTPPSDIRATDPGLDMSDAEPAMASVGLQSAIRDNPSLPPSPRGNMIHLLEAALHSCSHLFSQVLLGCSIFNMVLSQCNIRFIFSTRPPIIPIRRLISRAETRSHPRCPLVSFAKFQFTSSDLFIPSLLSLLVLGTLERHY